MKKTGESIHTKIWHEEPEDDNPYAAKACYCSGYDVFGDLLGKVSWIEYLYLLFKLELPTKTQAKALELIATAIANPGVRDLSVRAAMNAGVGGSTRASALMAALAVGAGSYGGSREVLEVIRWFGEIGLDLNNWRQKAKQVDVEKQTDTWAPLEHVPGFDPNGAFKTPLPVKQLLVVVGAQFPNGCAMWLHNHLSELEAFVGYPLAMSGAVAAGLMDIGFNEDEAELVYLILRLPGAAAHALEQESNGWRRYPFFKDDVQPMTSEEYQEMLKKLEL